MKLLPFAIAFSLTVAGTIATGPAMADEYDDCYNEITARDPNVGLPRMQKIWACTDERKRAKLGGAAEEKQSSAGAECNYDKKIGSCKGTIRIVSTSGGKGSYSAEIAIGSSAQSCSKVEYYIDNTPHQTVLKASNSAGESVFGTKPITRKSIEVSACSVYASAQ